MTSRPKSREKSSKSKLRERIDRISSLPDDVIGHILSFLPTKHVVATSILARRWKYLFTKVTTLDFDEAFVMKLPTPVQLPNLKSVHLISVKFSDDCSLSSFILGCPVLEELVIRGVWDGTEEINISSMNLRSLTLDFSEGYLEGFPRSNVTLDLPNLLRLNYTDYLASKYLLKNLNALDEARIEIWLDPEDFESVCDSVRGLINGVSNAKHLYLSGKCVEALSDGEYQLPVFHNLSELELGCTKYVHWRDVLCEFLHSSPVLEELVFPEGLSYGPNDDDDDNDDDEDGHVDNFWSKEQKSPVCLSSHLKVVLIESFFGLVEELKIARYFLKHGKVLEELILDWHIGSKREQCDLMKLRKARKANKNCSIELE